MLGAGITSLHRPFATDHAIQSGHVCLLEDGVEGHSHLLMLTEHSHSGTTFVLSDETPMKMTRGISSIPAVIVFIQLYSTRQLTLVTAAPLNFSIWAH